MSSTGTTRKRKKTVAAILLIIGIVVLIGLSLRFIHLRMHYAVTDAVFVKTDSLATLGFNRVNGRVMEMNKKEGDTVACGEVIARIDDESYRLEAARLEAQIRSANQKLEEQKLLLERLKKETELKIKIADARVAQANKEKDAMTAKAASIQAEIDQLKRDHDRFETLYREKAVAKQKAEDVRSRLAMQQAVKKSILENAAAVEATMRSARLAVKLAEAKRTQIEEVEKNIQSLAESIKGLTAALKNAESNVAECVLKSPITGRVAKQYTSVGDIVSPMSPVYAVLDPKRLYVVALLEENKLFGVTPGDPVTIRIDAYPDRKYKGVVRQVLPASAATFALAPRDISAGEFTKVAQRIPVRIDITDGDMNVLQVGLSGEVEIRRKGA